MACKKCVLLSALMLCALAGLGASLQVILLDRKPADNFIGYSVTGTPNWIGSSNFNLLTGRFTIDIPEGNWAIFMDEDLLTNATRQFTNAQGIVSSCAYGINWTRVSPVFTGPGYITVNIPVWDTRSLTNSPYFFRLQKL